MQAVRTLRGERRTPKRKSAKKRSARPGQHSQSAAQPQVAATHPQDSVARAGQPRASDKEKAGLRWDCTAKCNLTLGRHHANVNVLFSKSRSLLRFNVLATEFKTSLVYDVPLEEDMATNISELLVAVQNRGSDELLRTMSNIASCLTLSLRPGSIEPVVAHAVDQLRNTVKKEVQRVAHATQPLSKMELNRMLENDLATYDDGVPRMAATEIQKMYRGHFVRKFGACLVCRSLHSSQPVSFWLTEFDVLLPVQVMIEACESLAGNARKRLSRQRKRGRTQKTATLSKCSGSFAASWCGRP